MKARFTGSRVSCGCSLHETEPLMIAVAEERAQAGSASIDVPKPVAQGADGVFLIHGLGGTQYDLGSMHKRLKNAGFVTHSLTLPGHGMTPEDLVGVTAEDWIEAVVAKYREIRDMHATLHVMGMCMGSLLAAVLAQREA